MKITELNLQQNSLKSITIRFSELSTNEFRELNYQLQRVENKIQENQYSVLAFLDIFALTALLKNWSDLPERQSLSQIRDRHSIMWKGKNFSFDLTLDPIVYAIVNVTPDSFYDGAPQNLKLEHVLKKVASDMENGADVIELGGKSSRPGYNDIRPEEEWKRLKRPLMEIRKEFPKAVIAVDTDEADVMERVLDLGVDIINDIDGFDTDEKRKLIGSYQPALVVMNNGRAGFQFADTVYGELPAFFKKKEEELAAFGIKREQICLDAGVGFFNGDSGIDSVARIKSTALLAAQGLPVMAAISRKSFMENVFGATLEERLFSTLLFEQQMMADGGRVLRVHDPKETKRLVEAFKLYQKI